MASTSTLPTVIGISGHFTSYGFTGTVELLDEETGRRYFSTGEHGQSDYNWGEYQFEIDNAL